MSPVRTLLLCCLLPLIACARLPVDEAEAQCARAALSGGSSTAVTVGIGTGYGGWSYGVSGAGAGIAMTTTLPQRSSIPSAASYDACVRRKAGQPPVTPLAQRPELRP
jgi:hypothetical protein